MSKICFKKLYDQEPDSTGIVHTKSFIGNRFDRRRMKKLKKYLLSSTFNTKFLSNFKPDNVFGIMYDKIDNIFLLGFEKDDVYFFLMIKKDLYDAFLNCNEKDLYIDFNGENFILNVHSIGSVCMNVI